MSLLGQTQFVLRVAAADVSSIDLEKIDDVFRKDVLRLRGGGTSQQAGGCKAVSLAEALSEVRAHPNRIGQLVALEELKFYTTAAAKATTTPPPSSSRCDFCQKSRKTRPTFLYCFHSVCADCAQTLANLDRRKQLKCPTCMTTSTLDTAFEIVPDPLDAQPEEQQQQQDEEPAAVTTTPMTVEGPTTIRTAELELSSDLKVRHTLTSLDREFPAPEIKDKDLDADDQALFPNIPAAFLRHMRAASGTPPAKVAAIVAEIRRIKASDVTAKFVVISDFPRVLDAIEPYLDTVVYDCALQNENRHIAVGTKVVLDGVDGVIAGVTFAPNPRDRHRRVYDVDIKGEELRRGVERTDLTIKELVVRELPSAYLRPANGTTSLTRGGSDSRFDVNDTVEVQRPPSKASEPLEVGFRVKFITNKHNLLGTVAHVQAVQNDGSYTVGNANLASTVCQRADLEDLGSTRWTSARVLQVKESFTWTTARKVPPLQDITTDAASPMASVIGFTRLDGGTSSAQRGDILQAFQADPMTSVCLLTTRSAGVGLNLVCANNLILCEPSIDGASENQAIMRIHRIGQTRPVNILHFYTHGSIDERVLHRRARRGDDPSDDANICDDDAGDDGGGGKVMTWSDLKLLLGM